MKTTKAQRCRVVSSSPSCPRFSTVDLDEVCRTLAFHLHCPLDAVVPFGSTALVHQFKPNHKLANSDVDVCIPRESFDRCIDPAIFDVDLSACTPTGVKRLKAKPQPLASSTTKALVVSIPTTVADLCPGEPSLDPLSRESGGTETLLPWKKNEDDAMGVRWVCDLSELTLREAVDVIETWEPCLYPNGWHHGVPHRHKLSYTKLTSKATKSDKDKFPKAQRSIKYDCMLVWDTSVLQPLDIEVTYLETGKTLTQLAAKTMTSYKAFDLYLELKHRITTVVQEHLPEECTLRSGVWLAIYTAMVPRLAALSKELSLANLLTELFSVDWKSFMLDARPKDTAGSCPLMTSLTPRVEKNFPENDIVVLDPVEPRPSLKSMTGIKYAHLERMCTTAVTFEIVPSTFQYPPRRIKQRHYAAVSVWRCQDTCNMVDFHKKSQRWFNDLCKPLRVSLACHRFDAADDVSCLSYRLIPGCILADNLPGILFESNRDETKKKILTSTCRSFFCCDLADTTTTTTNTTARTTTETLLSIHPVTNCSRRRLPSEGTYGGSIVVELLGDHPDLVSDVVSSVNAVLRGHQNMVPLTCWSRVELDVGPNNAQQQWPVGLEALQHQQSSTTTYEAVSAADQQGGEDGDESSPSDDDDESSTSSSTRTRDGIVNVNTKGQQHKKDFKSRLQQHLMKVFGVETVKVTQHGEYVEAQFFPPLLSQHQTGEKGNQVI